MTMFNKFNLVKNKIITRIKNWWAKKIFSHKNIIKSIGDKLKSFFGKSPTGSIDDEMQEIVDIVNEDKTNRLGPIVHDPSIEDQYFADGKNWILVTNSTNVHSHCIFVDLRTSLPILMGIRFQKQKPRGVPNTKADPHPREYRYSIDSWVLYYGLYNAMSKGKFVWDNIRGSSSIHSPASAIPFKRIPYKQQQSTPNERK